MRWQNIRPEPIRFQKSRISLCSFIDERKMYRPDKPTFGEIKVSNTSCNKVMILYEQLHISIHSTVPFTLPTINISLLDILICQFDINSPKHLMYRLLHCAIVGCNSAFVTTSPAHLFAIRGRQERSPGTLQTHDQSLTNRRHIFRINYRISRQRYQKY